MFRWHVRKLIAVVPARYQETRKQAQTDLRFSDKVKLVRHVEHSVVLD